MQKGGRPIDVIWTKFNHMVDGSKVTAQCKLCLNAQSNHIGRMKKHYEKCVKQPRSSKPQPSTASAAGCGPYLPTRASSASPRLLSSSVLIHYHPRSVKLTSTVMWYGLKQLPKMTWMTRLLSFLYGCSLPFSIITSPLQVLGVQFSSSYKASSKQAVSNKLLDKCHDKYQAMAFMKQLLNNKCSKCLELSPGRPSSQ